MRQIILIAHNLRSCYNVGALMRTAEGLGVEKIYLTGYTPYPKANDDERLPHLASKIDRQIAKTALGAEKLLAWQHEPDLAKVLREIGASGFMTAALEQARDSIKLADFKPPEKIALIVGREVEGLEPDVLASCDKILEIPMQGQKESFNVTAAAAMALYALALHP